MRDVPAPFRPHHKLASASEKDSAEQKKQQARRSAFSWWSVLLSGVVAYGLFYYSRMGGAESTLPAPAAVTSIRGLRALVMGGTGAVGRCLVGDLLQSPAWSSVITIGRRPPVLTATYADVSLEAEAASGRWRNEIVDYDNLTPGLFEDVDVVFCALGTTRKVRHDESGREIGQLQPWSQSAK
jgi:hypothetical protein